MVQLYDRIRLDAHRGTHVQWSEGAHRTEERCKKRSPPVPVPRAAEAHVLQQGRATARFNWKVEIHSTARARAKSSVEVPATASQRSEECFEIPVTASAISR